MTEAEIDKLYVAAIRRVGGNIYREREAFLKPYFVRAKIHARAGNHKLALSELAKIDDEIAAALAARWRL